MTPRAGSAGSLGVVRFNESLLIAGLLGAAVAAAVAPAAVVWLASRHRLVDAAEAPPRDVAIVFGAEVYPDGRPSPYLRARLDLGAALFREGRVGVLLVSGDDDAAHHQEAQALKRSGVAQGVRESRVGVDADGLDTYDTCTRARRVFGVREAVLVSQSYHLPRAVTTCRAVGVDAVGVGDTSVRSTSHRWAEFARREYPAGFKMWWDVLSRRDPVLEPPRPDVAEALRS